MLQAFIDFIRNKKLFLSENRILLAVSGGLDSVVMTDLFHNAGFSFAIAHCNFQLRGEESEQDEVFVKKLAENYKVEYYGKRFETAAYAVEKGISIQMAARELRYEWFNTIIKEEGFDFFATAHHHNDLIETIILNITKGTDIHGITGIRAIAGKAVRPLLFADRDLIKEYAEKNNLLWREDSSNASLKYQRNFIRHEVIPALEKINPSLEKSLEESLEKFRAAERIFNEKISGIREEATREKNGVIYLDKGKISGEKEAGIIFFELIRGYGFNYEEAGNLLNAVQTGKKIENADYVIVNDRDHFVVSEKKKNAEEEGEIIIHESTEKTEAKDFILTFKKLESGEIKFSPSADYAWLDIDKLEYPLKLRTWKEGDYFIPFGMKGKKKLSDFLTELKIPLNLKQKIKVLVSGESIVWVVGYRINERYRITEGSKKILFIHKQNP